MGPRLPAAGREASSLTSVLEAHAAGELDEEDRQNLRDGRGARDLREGPF